jgi:methionine-rich copper-binding protein CopC
MSLSNRLTVSAALIFVAELAAAHPALVNSSPKAGEIVDAAPKQIRLSFNEPVEAAFTTVKVVNPSGKEGPAEPTQADGSDARAVVVQLTAVTSGIYKARWSVLGHDGHRVKGEFSFTVK